MASRPELAAAAVEETLRVRPISFGLARIATEDVRLAAVLIPAGTIIIANTAAANRDPDVFDEPDRFDITRKRVAGVLNFGSGAHYCLSSHLARLELTETLALMSRKLPNLRRSGDALWPSMTGITGPRNLPISSGAVEQGR